MFACMMLHHAQAPPTLSVAWSCDSFSPAVGVAMGVAVGGTEAAGLWKDSGGSSFILVNSAEEVRSEVRELGEVIRL